MFSSSLFEEDISDLEDKNNNDNDKDDIKGN